MKTRTPKIVVLMAVLFVIATRTQAQVNIFRADNVTITSSVTATNLVRVNDGVTTVSSYAEFPTPSSGPIELLMTLNSAEVVSSYDLISYSARYARSIAFAGSNDNINWDTLDRQTNNTSATLSAVFSNSTAYKYYKFVFRDMYSTATFRIVEVAGFKDAVPAPVVEARPGTYGNQMTVSWGQVLGLANGRYELERSTNGIDYTLISSPTRTTLTYNETTLKRSTAYWYRMRAWKNNVYSAYSNIATAVTSTDAITTAPTLSYTLGKVGSTVRFNWALTFGGNGRFELERSEDGLNYTLVDTFVKSVTTYTDTTLTQNTAYWYRVRAVNEVSASPWSTPVSFTTVSDVLVMAPTISASSPTGTQAHISWSLSVPTGGYFELEKSNNGVDFTLLKRLDTTIKSFDEESLTPNTTYYYRVRAFNYLGASPYSDIAAVTTGSITAIPADITDDGGKLYVNAENRSGANSAEGSSKFIDNSAGTKWLVFTGTWGQNVSAVYKPTGSYVVLSYVLTTANDAEARDPRNWTFSGSNDSTNWVTLDTRTNQLGNVNLRYTAFRYDIADPGTVAYKFYRIGFTANNGATDGVAYQIAEWEILGIDPNAPALPGNLTVTGTTETSVSLSWTQDPANQANSFRLQRSGDGQNFTTIATLPASPLSYKDTLLADSSDFYYRIQAIGNSPTAVTGWSSVVKASTGFVAGRPIAPIDLTAKITDTMVTLQWTDRSYNETGYRIQRSIDNVHFNDLAQVGADIATAADSTVWPAYVYYYRVAGQSGNQTSLFSNTLMVTTTGFNATPLVTLPLMNKTICSNSGSYIFNLNGIVGGTGNEQNQEMRITGVKADSAHYFNQMSFDPAVVDGKGTITLTGSGVAAAGDSVEIFVTIKDNGGLINFGTDTAEISFKIFYQPLTVSISSDKPLTDVQPNTLLNLVANTNYPSYTPTYQWSDAAGIEGSRNNINLRVRPTVPATYQVKATSIQGCTATAQVTVVPAVRLGIANVLTPNGDGKNERWVIHGIHNYPNNTVSVFDRSGRLVYMRRSYTNDWDGSYNGKPLSEGAYMYKVDLGDGSKPLTGMINIIRER